MRSAHLSRLYAEAESRGLRVKAQHLRNADGEFPLLTIFQCRRFDLTPQPKGGATSVFLYDKEKNIVASAMALCSQLDHYDKRRGVEIALGRALRLHDDMSRGRKDAA